MDFEPLNIENEVIEFDLGSNEDEEDEDENETHLDLEHSEDYDDYNDESSTARRDILCREAIKYVEEGAESISLYNVAMEALSEAAKKVAAAKQNSASVMQSNLANRSDQEVSNLTKRSDHELTKSENEMGQLQSCSVNQDKKIQELTDELENAIQRCEAYRAKLLAVLNNMEEQKLKISVKVQNVRLTLKS
ncbi:hypothetical protein Vadar_023269 [Vaccinium darrowii]|uniref:Uncharacterized protein n=1 Tax=Vaccinium darrowii TaxID=229202 RepID=A0ACB7Y8A6_9ERIC|nr:hypothetical protein Vadar_023269 [Vaccinium darrowii]